MRAHQLPATQPICCSTAARVCRPSTLCRTKAQSPNVYVTREITLRFFALGPFHSTSTTIS